MQKRAALFSPKGRCKHIATVSRITYCITAGWKPHISEMSAEQLCLTYMHSVCLKVGPPQRNGSVPAETGQSVNFCSHTMHQTAHRVAVHNPAFRGKLTSSDLRTVSKVFNGLCIYFVSVTILINVLDQHLLLSGPLLTLCLNIAFF